MKRGSLNFLEVHVEKFILGLTGVFLLAMLWMFLIQSPNKVKYGNEEVTPRGLHQAILSDARDLQRKVEQASPGAFEPPRYSQRLKQEYDQGVLGGASEGPELPRHLRLASTFGQQIVVPGLKEEEVGSVALVTPLKPSQPVLRTGRSKVVRAEVSLGDEEGVVEEDAGEQEAVEASEVAWVCVAAHFDTKAQRNEMTKAGYAPYLANPYVVSMDVERQEVLASGEWSDWQTVEPSKAMPKLELPKPAMDDETGTVLNKEAIQRAFHVIKQEQTQLMQPQFYQVEAGDGWVNPLEAAVEEEEEEENEETAEQRRQEREERRQQRAVRTPVGGGGRMIGGGRRSGGGMRVLGGGGGPVGGGGGTVGGGGTAPTGRSGAARDRAEGQKRARQDLKEAEAALRKKEYAEAQQLVNRVLDNEYAKSYRRRAEKLLERIQKGMERERAGGRATLGGGGTGPVAMMGGGRRTAGGGTMAAGGGGAFARSGGETTELYRDPDTDQPAIWFHDDTVESGKTYRYRTRVRLWNRYVGRMKPLRDSQDAKRSVLAGEWSLPSDPIGVTPRTYFFVRNPRLDKKSASMEVWTWREGEWLDERFDIEVGDVIGGVEKVKLDEWDDDGRQIREDIDFTTNALVLDLRFDQPIKQRIAAGKGFNYSEKTTLVLVYLDPADGQVKERVQLFDKYDPIRKKLEDQSW
jgi:hypothetical protein